jgi:hypothetical protein
MSIGATVEKYYGKARGDIPWRYRSWEHCFDYFRRVTPNGIQADRHHAALQLGFYLASWGMYRGSTFALQYDYTIHLGIVDCLASPEFTPLWQEEFGCTDEDIHLLPTISDSIKAITQAYRPFAKALDKNISDTLVTKVLLGTMGCLPACDELFKLGFCASGFSYSYLNQKFVKRVFTFCRDNCDELRAEQERINQSSPVHYPLMKIVDMYFWQIGYDLRYGA